MGWPFGDDLPRTSADIPRLDGDPATLRVCASDMRSLAGELATPKTAASQLQSITDGTSWNGAAFDAFRNKVDKNPKSSDIENAQSIMHQAADVLTTLASGISDCQSRIDWCRQQIDDLNLPDGDIPEDLRLQVQNIKNDADDARGTFDGHMRTAGDRFDELTGQTVYAEPPPGFFERAAGWVAEGFEFVGEFAIGIVEGVWEMVKGLYSIVALAVQPWKWDEAWATFTQILEFAWNNPGEFFSMVGKAIVDWDTLMESPGRWLGKLVPAIVLAVVTGGAGAVASGLGRAATLASRFSRLSRVANKLDGVASVARRVDNFANVPRRLMTSGPSSVRTALTAIDNVAGMPGRVVTSAFRGLTGRSGPHTPIATNVDLPSTNTNSPSTFDTSTSTGGSDTTTSDTGGTDTTTTDSGGNNTTTSDTGGNDTTTSDSGGNNTTTSDSGGNDTGGNDTGGNDTGGNDTGTDTGGTDTTHTAADTGGTDTTHTAADTGGTDTTHTAADTGGTDTGTGDPIDTTSGTDGGHSGTTDTSTNTSHEPGSNTTHAGDGTTNTTSTGDPFDSGTGSDPFDAPEHRPVDNPADLLNSPEFRPDTSGLDAPDYRPVDNPADLLNSPEYQPGRDPLDITHQHAGGDGLDLADPDLAPAGVAAAPLAMARHVPNAPGGGGSGPSGPTGPHTPHRPGNTGGSGGDPGGGGPGGGGNGPGGPGGPGGPRGPNGPGGSDRPDDPFDGDGGDSDGSDGSDGSEPTPEDRAQPAPERPTHDREQELQDRLDRAEANDLIDFDERGINDHLPVDQQNGTQGSYLVNFREGGNVSRGIWKPISGDTNPRADIPEGGLAAREVAAARLAEDLGYDDLVPPTTMWDRPGEPGSLQHWVEDTTPSRDVDSYSQHDRERMAVLDYVTGNTDRGPNNFRTGPNGEVVAIDNGCSFPVRQAPGGFSEYANPIHSGFVANQLNQPFSPATMDRLRSIDPDGLRQTLRESGIEDGAIDEAMNRFDEIRRNGTITGEAWGGEIRDTLWELARPRPGQQ